jgi:cysteine desulfuration protein SufE
MTDPFVQPQEDSARAAIAAIGEDLALFDDDMDRYEWIIDQGRTLPPFPAAWQDDVHRVPGCQSKVWLESAERDGRLYLAGGSDAIIVSGLVALMLRVHSGRPPAEITATGSGFLTDLGLMASLSAGRGNGLASMAQRIQELARAAR